MVVVRRMPLPPAMPEASPEPEPEPEAELDVDVDGGVEDPNLALGAEVDDADRMELDVEADVDEVEDELLSLLDEKPARALKPPAPAPVRCGAVRGGRGPGRRRGRGGAGGGAGMWG